MPRDTEYAQQALAANDEFFSVEALQQAEVGTFGAILEQLDTQSNIHRNTETPIAPATSPDGTHALYVSNSGYSALFAGLSPRMLYVPEGQGARQREAEAVVDQVVLHSFGYAIDRAALRAGARSIQVDERIRGHNPYKVAQRMQQVLFGANQSTTHLISRRGDIISATPWNRAPAMNSQGEARQGGVPTRSISVELESWHTAYNVPFSGTPEEEFKVLGQEPYTLEQLAALAFLLKKLSIWSNVDPTTPLGFTFNEVREKVGTGSGHVPGIVNVSALSADHKGSPGGEFEYPPDWALGDDIPEHLDEALWTRRNEIYQASRGAGYTLPSHYATVKGIYDSQPDYAYESELFEDQPSSLYAELAPQRGGQNAAAQSAINARGNGVARAQRLQGRARANQYDAAAIANDAVILVTAAYTTRQGTTAGSEIAVPILRNALAFDFGTGNWVISTSRIASPNLPTRRQVPPPTQTPATATET